MTFDINGKRKMGLKLSKSDFDPFLYIGFNLAILQSFGKDHEEMGILRNSAIIFATLFTPPFKNLPESLSSFLLFLRFNTFNIYLRE